MKSEREEEGCKIKKKVHGGRDGDLTKLGVREEKLIENSKKKSRLFEKGRNVVIKNGSGGRRGGETGEG